MASEKVDFLVQQSYPCSETKSSLKAGAAVTLNQSGSVTEVVHEETVLGFVPASDQQLFQDRTPTCTIRSVKRQDGKLSQILVRAIFRSSEATAAPPAGTAVCTCSVQEIYICDFTEARQLVMPLVSFCDCCLSGRRDCI